MIRESKDGYPELEEKAEFIFNHLSQEEETVQQDDRSGTVYLSRYGKSYERERQQRTCWCRCVQII